MLLNKYTAPQYSRQARLDCLFRGRGAGMVEFEELGEQGFVGKVGGAGRLVGRRERFQQSQAIRRSWQVCS